MKLHPVYFNLYHFLLGLELAIFGIENFDGKYTILKKYKFKESALVTDKGRSRKIKRYEDLH